MAEMTMQSGHHTLRRLLLTGALLFTITGITAQDDIYGDTDTYNPLGGYSTHDQHIESGNTYTTNYYSDDAYDYFWALRIWRFQSCSSSPNLSPRPAPCWQPGVVAHQPNRKCGWVSRRLSKGKFCSSSSLRRTGRGSSAEGETCMTLSA